MQSIGVFFFFQVYDCAAVPTIAQAFVSVRPRRDKGHMCVGCRTIRRHGSLANRLVPETDVTMEFGGELADRTLPRPATWSSLKIQYFCWYRCSDVQFGPGRRYLSVHHSAVSTMHITRYINM